MRRTLTTSSLILFAGLAMAGEAPPAGDHPNRGSPEARDARMKEANPDAFKEADADGDGKLSETERAKFTELVAKKTFATFDTNKDGSVDKAEFIAGMKARSEERNKKIAEKGTGKAFEVDETKLGEAFDKADGDHDGKLTAEELGKATAGGRGRKGGAGAPGGDQPGQAPEQPGQ